MSIITAEQRDRIAKVIAMVSSDSDAEALNAARKADELVKAAGTTWRSILAPVCVPVANPAPFRRPGEAPHAAKARTLLSVGRSVITAKERAFLQGIMAYRTVTPRQEEWLADIARKVEGGADAA